jgi:hypothetical protein
VHLAKYICNSQIWCTKWHLGNLMIILVVVNWTCKHPQGNCHSQQLVLLVSCLQFLSNWWNLWHWNLIDMFFILSIRHLGFANGTSYQVLVKSHIFQNINKKVEKIIWNWKSNWDSHMKANMSLSLSTNETLGEIGTHAHTHNKLQIIHGTIWNKRIAWFKSSASCILLKCLMNGILQTFEGVFLTSPFKVVIPCFCGNNIFYYDLCMQNAKTWSTVGKVSVIRHFWKNMIYWCCYHSLKIFAQK